MKIRLPALIHQKSTFCFSVILCMAIFPAIPRAQADDPPFSDANWEAIGVNGDVEAMVVDNLGNLYVAGNFTMVGNVNANRIAKWNGSSWSALGSGIGGTSGSTVYALAVSGNDVYVGGNFLSAGGNAATNIARWNGSSWSALPPGLKSGEVYALACLGNNVYAGGAFVGVSVPGTRYIAKWDGGSWSALGSGMTNYFDWFVNALAVSGNTLYAAGNRLAKWDGNAWSALGSGTDGGNVGELTVSGNNLYAGGFFTTAGGVPANKIAKWNGSSWSALGSGISNGVNGGVYAIEVLGRDVYVGGQFDIAGGIAAYNIAKWNGNSWSTLGSGIPYGKDVRALAVTGNYLYVGGHFPKAGDKVSPSLARAVLSLSDLKATSLDWNTSIGGLDFTYSVTNSFTNSSLSTPTTAKLFWANGTSVANILSSTPIFTQNIPASFSGQSATIHVPPSALTSPLNGVTHILLVVDPDNLIPESNEGNNSISLLFAPMLLFRESAIGSWGFGPEGIPGWDHVAFYGAGRVFESHPGYPVGSYWDPIQTNFINITEIRGVQAQHTKGSFQYDATNAPSTAGNVEVPIEPTLAMQMAAFIEDQMDATYTYYNADGKWDIEWITEYFQPDQQKNKPAGTGYTCVGLIERAAEEAGLNGGEGFIPNDSERIIVGFSSIPFLLPGTLKYYAAKTAESSDMKGLLDPVDFILTDPANRRLGHTAMLGTLDEIPGAYYSGDGNLEQFIIPNPLPGQYHLQLIGLGSHAAAVVGGDFEGQIFEGFLGIGETTNMSITVPPSTNQLNTFPAITIQPQTQTNLVGTLAEFTVSATGTAPLLYQWRKGGANLNGETNSTLSLSNVQTNDAGNYVVVVTNNYGSVTSLVATLTVVSAPVIAITPQSRTNMVGTLATFTVGATGTAPLAYRWRKSGASLTDNSVVSGANSTMLSLTNVQLGDAGNYDVVVTNNYGSVTSQVATLLIQTNTPSPLSDLLAYYPFDGNANDASGHGRDGIVEGATLTSNRLGRANSAYTVTGSQYIRVEGLDPDNYAQGFTFGGWVRIATVGGSLVYWVHDQGWGSSFILFDSDFNAVHFRCGSGNPASDHSVTGISLTQNQWQHIFVTHGALKDRLYVGGQLVNEWTAYPLAGNVSTLKIGWGGNWSAVVDDIAVYGRELTAPEVESVFNTASLVPTPILTLQTPVLTSSNFSFQVSGSIGWTTVVERAAFLIGPWTNVSSVLIGTNGMGQFQDTNLLTSPGFYRARRQ